MLERFLSGPRANIVRMLLLIPLWALTSTTYGNVDADNSTCFDCESLMKLRAPFGDLAREMGHETDYENARKLLGDYDCRGWSPVNDGEANGFIVENGAAGWVQGHILWWKHFRNSRGSSCVVRRPVHGFEQGFGDWEILEIEEAIILIQAFYHKFNNPYDGVEEPIPEYCLKNSPGHSYHNNPMRRYILHGHWSQPHTKLLPCEEDVNAAIEGTPPETKVAIWGVEPAPMSWPSVYTVHLVAFDDADIGQPCTAHQITPFVAVTAAHCIFQRVNAWAHPASNRLNPPHGRVITLYQSELRTFPFYVNFDPYAGFNPQDAAKDLAVIRFAEGVYRDPNYLPFAIDVPSFMPYLLRGYPEALGTPFTSHMFVGTGTVQEHNSGVLLSRPSLLASQVKGASGGALVRSNPLAMVVAIQSGVASISGTPNSISNPVGTPLKLGWLLSEAAWIPDHPVTILAPEEGQQISVGAPTQFIAQRGVQVAAQRGNYSIWWISSRGNVLGAGDEIDVAWTFRGGAQRIYALVSEGGLEFDDPEDIDVEFALEAADGVRVRSVFGAGPWGELEFPEGPFCVEDLAAGGCDVYVRWSTAEAPQVRLKHVESDTLLSASYHGNTRFPLDAQSHAKIELSLETGRILDRKTTQVVTPTGVVSARDGYCEVLPTASNAGATTCEIRLDWSTQHAPMASVWRVGIDPPSAPVLVRSQTSGANYPAPVEQGSVVRFELRQKGSYESGLLAQTGTIQAVRYADAFEWDDHYSRSASHVGPMLRNFHVPGDTDWMRVPFDFLTSHEIFVRVTGATSQVRPRIVAYYLCGGPSVPEHGEQIPIGHDVTAAGSFLETTVTVDPMVCYNQFGIGHGLLHVNLRITNALGTACERTVPPPNSPCDSHSYTVAAEVIAPILGDEYEVDDELSLAWEMPDPQCYYDHPDFDSSTHIGFGVKNHSIHSAADIDWTVGFAEEFGGWHSNLFLEHLNGNAPLVVDVWTVIGSTISRPNALMPDALFGSILVQPGQGVRLDANNLMPASGIFAIRVRSFAEDNLTALATYRLYSAKALFCPQ